MKNATKSTPESRLLDLLKQVLPKAAHDAKLAGTIYQAVESQLKAQARAAAFEKFCAQAALPDLEPKSLAGMKQQLAASFGDGGIKIKPHPEAKCLAVEVSLPDGSQFSGEIRVDPQAAAAVDEDPEITLKFVPFPVCLPGDPELVWLLAKRESMTPDEGGIALAKIEEDFWASKTGQKLIRDRVERSFPEFIARVPGGILSDAGLKRHYKTPEPVKLLRRLAK